ncbi:MAG TPA: hemerythrin domain-containing protein [Dissulfurispiraceae bacterium]
MAMALDEESRCTRRTLLRLSALAGAGLVLGQSGKTLYAAEATEENEEKEGKVPERISPVEDLMREHGVLRRVLLIYEAILRRLPQGEQGFGVEALGESVRIIRSFIEDYHEQLEEEHLFPLFRKAGKHTGLVDVLEMQHKAGRRVSERIQRFSTREAMGKPFERQLLGDSLEEFIRMYRPHAAREDTALFPAFRSVVSPGDYEALGKTFEEEEQRLFGEHGFERVVGNVAAIEKTLGIYELSQFTPR